MRLCFGSFSAIQFWRLNFTKSIIEKKRMSIPKSFVPSLNSEEAKWIVDNYGLSLPISDFVECAGNRRRNAFHVTKVLIKNMPSKEILHIGANLYITSPELAIAQVCAEFSKKNYFPSSPWFSLKMASFFPEILISQLMMEFAGKYRYSHYNQQYCSELEPITSCEKLKSFAHKAGYFKGRLLFLKAINLMMDNSFSPAETNLTLMMTLPMKMGGLGVQSKPILNKEIRTTSNGLEKTRYADLCYPDEKIIVEYNGGFHHGQRANKDDKRRNELNNVGFRVVVINKENVESLEDLEEELAFVISKIGRVGNRPYDHANRFKDLKAILAEGGGAICSDNRHCILPAYINAG